jgi:LacI family transcriptional regulator
MVTPKSVACGCPNDYNTTARNLQRANQRTATIGLLLDDVANPFSSALHRAIEDVARQHNTLVFAGSSDQGQIARRRWFSRSHPGAWTD